MHGGHLSSLKDLDRIQGDAAGKECTIMHDDSCWLGGLWFIDVTSLRT